MGVELTEDFLVVFSSSKKFPKKKLKKMDVPTALQQFCKQSVAARVVARGLNEAARALDQRKAVVCLLASNCNEDNYVKLIEALCSEHQIPLVKVDDNAVLGQWVGLCKYDED